MCTHTHCALAHSTTHTRVCTHDTPHVHTHTLTHMRAHVTATLTHTQSPLPHFLPSLSFPDFWGGEGAELPFTEKPRGVGHWVWLFPCLLMTVFLGCYHPRVVQVHEHLGS